MRKYHVLALALLAGALVSSDAYAQQRRISGKVTATTGEPLGAASVTVVGTTLGSYTDESGQYSLLAPTGTATLLVRRVGFKRQTVAVTPDQTSANVSLERDVLELETMVVTGQATSVSSQNAANAVTVVSGAEVNRVPQPTVENAFQGKIPGAVVTQNGGAPGGGIQVQIRGSNTINGAYQPLYVVDGVIMNNDAFSNGLNSITGAGGGVITNQDQQVNRIADLNPEDIDNVQVLKGPSAGAIYGSRGANGVIIITTKRGTAGKPSLNIVQRTGTQFLAKKYDMRCFSYAEAVAQADADFGMTLTPEDYAGCVDPQEVLYGNHFLSYETAASSRGGAQNTTYFVSGMVKHDAGLAVNTGYSKQSLRLNLNQVVGANLNLRASSELLHTLTERGISGNDNNNIAPYTIIGITPTYFDYRRRDPLTGARLKNPYVPGGANVLQDQESIRTPEDVYRLIGNIQGDWTIFSRTSQNLTLSALGGIDAFNDHARVYSPPNTYIEQSHNLSPYPGTIVDGNSDVVNANLNATLVHKFIASLGTATTSIGMRQEHSEYIQAVNRGQGLFPGVKNFATAIQTAVVNQQNLTRTRSYFAQEELLALDERLLFTAAVNAERSSTNGDSAKYFAFPKFSASYNLPFTPLGLDNFKLRVATGKAGNRVPIDLKNTYLTQLSENGIIGLRPAAQIGLANVQPEVTTETEGGFDAQFLGGRAQAGFTIYHKQTTGLVLLSAPPPSSGFTSKVINGGALKHDGVEAELTVAPFQGQMFGWQTHTTFSHDKSKVLSLPVPGFYTGNGFGERTARNKVQVGLPVDAVMAYTGFDANGARKESYIGSASPDFQMGFGNDFTSGPFRLSTLLEWRHGGYVANLSQTYLEYGPNGQSGIAGGNFADTAMNNADQAKYASGYPAFLEHGSFAKLREVTLSYSLNPSVANTLFRGLSKDVRLELNGRNLYTWMPSPPASTPKSPISETRRFHGCGTWRRTRRSDSSSSPSTPTSNLPSRIL